MTAYVPFFVALVAAFVTAVGWVFTYYSAKRREDRTRRLEAATRYIQRQVEEFYGPLFNLVHQIVICNHVQNRILSGRKPDGERCLSSADADKIQQFFHERYFAPLHAEATQILKSR